MSQQNQGFHIPSIHEHGPIGGALQSVASIVERAVYRAKHRTTLDIDRIAHLSIHYSDQDASHTEAGYYAIIDGKEMKLSDTAFGQANKLIRVRDKRYWGQFPDTQAFPKTLTHIWDSKDNPRLLVRHDGLQVNSFLSPSYKIRDAAETLDDIIPQIESNMGAIMGVSAIEQGSGDVLSYRVVIGGNLMPSVKEEFGQYMMFMINLSETGLLDTQTVMGAFRGSCTNSAIRIATMSKWNHKSDLDTFMEETNGILRLTSYYRNSFSQVFEELLRAPVGVPMGDLLRMLVRMKLISNAHYEAAMVYVDGQTEDGRQHETQYDAFNLLTRSAQDLSFAQRQIAEQRALTIFTSKGGLAEVLRDAEDQLPPTMESGDGNDETEEFQN